MRTHMRSYDACSERPKNRRSEWMPADGILAAATTSGFRHVPPAAWLNRTSNSRAGGTGARRHLLQCGIPPMAPDSEAAEGAEDFRLLGYSCRDFLAARRLSATRSGPGRHHVRMLRPAAGALANDPRAGFYDCPFFERWPLCRRVNLYSAILIPESLTTFAQCATWEFMRSRKSEGVPPTASAPSLPIASRTFGFASALLMAALS